MADVFIIKAQEAYILTLVKRFKLRRLLQAINIKVTEACLHGQSSISLDEKFVITNSRNNITTDTRAFLALVRILRLQGYTVTGKKDNSPVTVIAWGSPD